MQKINYDFYLLYFLTFYFDKYQHPLLTAGGTYSVWIDCSFTKIDGLSELAYYLFWPVSSDYH